MHICSECLYDQFGRIAVPCPSCHIDLVRAELKIEMSGMETRILESARKRQQRAQKTCRQ